VPPHDRATRAAGARSARFPNSRAALPFRAAAAAFGPPVGSGPVCNPLGVAAARSLRLNAPRETREAR